MKNWIMSMLVLAFVGLCPASPANAFGISGGGGRIGYLSPDPGDGGVAIGAHVEFESPGSRWHLQPNVLYWHGDPLTGFNANLDAFYHFGSEARTTPYLGGGVGLSIVDLPGSGGSNSDPAGNMFGGVRFPAGRNQLFLEGRYTFSDVNQASITFGATFR
ncbi:MAG: hypothetical protein ABI960_01495 [Candidatus Eisenbacteria bacterium]